MTWPLTLRKSVADDVGHAPYARPASDVQKPAGVLEFALFPLSTSEASIAMARLTLLARTCVLALPGVVGLAAAACSSSTSRAGFDGPPADSTSSSSSSGASGNTSGFIGGDSGVPLVDGCTDAAKLVYVLSLEGDLYSFAPADKKFTKVGALDCTLDGKTFTTVSMAVDRDAVAWVNMRDALSFTGESVMFKVDTKTAACTPTNIRGSWGGMGFSTNVGTTDKETLYMIGGSGPVGALLTVDFVKEKINSVVNLPEQVDLELTGTGDGRLYGFLQSNPLAIAAVDKTTAVFSQRAPLSSVQQPKPPMFAFSFWGGDFYVYTATDTSASKTTTVSRYRPSDKSLNNAYMTSIGFHIVGAGVSTCAPTVAPK